MLSNRPCGELYQTLNNFKVIFTKKNQFSIFEIFFMEKRVLRKKTLGYAYE